MTIQQISKSFAELKINELEQDPFNFLPSDFCIEDTYNSEEMIWCEDAHSMASRLSSFIEFGGFSTVPKSLFDLPTPLPAFANPLGPISMNGYKCEETVQASETQPHIPPMCKLASTESRRDGGALRNV